jgi:hypothetical protein
MLHLKKSLSKMAVLALTVSMLAAGCSDAGKESANNTAAGSGSNETAVTEQPTVNPETEQPAATEEPAIDSATSEPAATDKPAATDEDKKESEAEAKPAATAKPTNKPAAVKPTAKPAQKPAATAKPTQKPTQKPTEKPSATPKPSQKPSTDIKVSDISAKIMKDIEMPRLVTVEGERIKDVYGIDAGSLLSDAVFMQAMMNTKATELVIVKLKSDKNYDAVAEALETRAASIQKTFETYLQDQYEDAQNYKIVRSGSYVMLSISHDQDKVVEIFNDFFK